MVSLLLLLQVWSSLARRRAGLRRLRESLSRSVEERVQGTLRARPRRLDQVERSRQDLGLLQARLQLRPQAAGQVLGTLLRLRSRSLQAALLQVGLPPTQAPRHLRLPVERQRAEHPPLRRSPSPRVELLQVVPLRARTRRSPSAALSPAAMGSAYTSHSRRAAPSQVATLRASRPQPPRHLRPVEHWLAGRLRPQSRRESMAGLELEETLLRRTSSSLSAAVLPAELAGARAPRLAPVERSHRASLLARTSPSRSVAQVPTGRAVLRSSTSGQVELRLVASRQTKQPFRSIPGCSIPALRAVAHGRIPQQRITTKALRADGRRGRRAPARMTVLPLVEVSKEAK